MIMRILVGLLTAILSFASLADEVKSKVAVTDLAYEEQVKDYVKTDNSSFGPDYSHIDVKEGTYTYIRQSELHKFVADIKGAIKKKGLFDLIQGRPYSGDPEDDNINDIISRIDQGDFTGADYVLFGRVSDIEFAENEMNVQHTNTYSKSLNLTLVAEFKLIDTNTHEIKAAFTAKGEGKELKLVNSLDKKVTLSRARLTDKVSKDLAKNVISQLSEQLTGEQQVEDYSPPIRNNIPADVPPTVIRRP